MKLGRLFVLVLLVWGLALGPALAANRFWVGGTASWDGTIGLKWALTSGGVGGQAAPTSSDDVFFDAASGAVTVTVAASATAKSLTFTGFTGTFAGGSPLAVSGDVVLASGMTYTKTGGMTINATGSFTSNGKAITDQLNINGTSITTTLVDAFVTTSNLSLVLGTLDAAANNVNVTCGVFTSNGALVRGLNMGSGTWTATGAATAWSATNATGLTINAGTSTIVLSNAVAGNKTFAGVAGVSYNNVYFSGEGGLIITGANTFADLKADGGNISISFPASTTTTVSSLTINGSAGNYTVLQSGTPGTQATISDTSGTNAMTFVALRDMAFVGGATFTANPGYDLGNNTGITITSPGGGGSTNQVTRQGLGL